jgi:hypothetical protein
MGEGWAIVSGAGVIYIKTVSDTRRAAIINWLVAYQNISVTMHHSDADIERMWIGCGQYVHCRPVIVQERRP